MNNHPILSFVVLGFGVGIGSYLMRKLMSGDQSSQRNSQHSGYDNKLQSTSQDRMYENLSSSLMKQDNDENKKV